MKTLQSIKWSTTEKTVALLAVFIFTAKLILSANLTASIGWTIKPDSFVSFLQHGYNQFTTSTLSILFVVAFFLLSPDLENIRSQAFAFLGGVLLTVWLTLNQVIEPNHYILTALLCLSVLYIAIENIFAFKLRLDDTRVLFVFIFGLLHGAFFGSNFVATGFPNVATIGSSLIFSMGLILGLASLLIVLYLVITRILSEKSFYKKGIVTPLSVLFLLYSVGSLIRLVFMKN